uniref:Crystaline entomocidal protoxin n=1 Tax=Bacillus thuringiensis TaxID=1428 RepID=M1E9M6_BACTU|nr:Cry32Aa1-like protein [Bacillus thuringiensis]
MNQNYERYGNNEMEILDPGMRNARYPYATPPGANFQNMNYTEWIDMCAGVEPFDTASDVRNGLIIGTGVAWALLGLIPGIGPAASAIAGLFNVLIPYWWPDNGSTPGTTEAQISWDQLMGAVEAMIDEKIAALNRSNAIARWEGIQLLAVDFYQARCDWLQDPDNPTKQGKVRDTFDDVEDYLKVSMPFFRASGYEVQMLAMYAQAANMHLLFLRDVVLNGLAWGFQQYEVDRYYSNVNTLSNPGLRELLAEYTDYCIRWYNTGLQSQYVTGYWDKYNDFRKNMTLMVLDVVAIWPTFDVKNYSLPTKSQLTRLVYTRMLRGVYGALPSIDPLEKSLVAAPQLFRWLVQLNYYAYDPYTTPGNYGYGMLGGVQLDYKNTLSENLHRAPLQGVTTSIHQPVIVNDKANQSIYLTERKGAEDSGFKQLRYRYIDGTKSRVVGQTLDTSETFTPLGMPCRRDEIPSTTCDPCVPNNPCRVGTTNTNESCMNYQLYSHRLAHVGAYTYTFNPSAIYLRNIGYAWSHFSSDTNNLLDSDRITQIPAVKAYSLEGAASVIKGPGSTGGDLISMSPDAYVYIRLTGQLQKGYQVRLRYACQGTGEVLITRKVGEIEDYWEVFDVPSTLYSGGAFTYKSFGYFTASKPLDSTSSPNWTMLFYNSGNTPIIIDKIEFIPILGSLTEYEEKQSLESARKAVNALFFNNAKNALRMDVTDYAVDQAANKVDCMSDDIFPKEKMMLRDQVKHAKRLSQARNLLNYGDFESPDWSNENGWRVSNSVTAQAGQPISRGRYLNMPGARSMEFGNTLYPTYAYQKVNESKLKPYTRYLVRGFVGNATELELFVTRYGKEVHDKMNIPFSTMDTSNQTVSGSNRCGTGQVAGYMMPNAPCQTNAYPPSIPMSSTNGWCEDKQYFVFPIDVGEMYPRTDLGIGIGFKISSTAGMAQLDNLEVIEANPLTGGALARVKKREQKWKREMEQECALTEKTVSAATQAVNDLFTSPEHNRLKPTVTMQDILNAEKKVNNIPYVQDPYFEEIPGMNSVIFQDLQSNVQIAFTLYNQRNVIRNGDFSSGLSNWHATAGANVQQKDGNPHVLVISQWDANVSQDVCVQPEHGYVLRVTARKEGSGNGYVTISNCTEANTETVTFTSDEMVPTTRPSVRPQRPVEPGICDTTRYGESFGIVPEMNPRMNEQPESYETGSCSCGCGNRSHTPSTKYPTQAYGPQPNIQNRNQPSSGYITKMIEIFPETNRMRIEIGETEGTFLVESIEFICIED